MMSPPSSPSPPSDHATAAPLLELRGITKRFGALVANDAVDFTLRPGEIHAIVGENGAGKTTLMNICFGLEHPDAGTLRLCGAPIRLRHPADALRLGIGMVHQHFMLVPVFTVLENVVLGVEPRGPLGTLNRAAARARLRDLSERYALLVEPDALVEDLAIGQQQRVEILKALYRDARILILDEPTAVLTPQEVDGLFGVLRGLAANGVGIVFITHKLNESLAVADRITVLRRGQVVATVEPHDTDAARLAALMVGRDVTRVRRGAPADPGPTVLRVKDVCVRDARGLLAVHDVSFDARAGEVLGIAGVQGNGQTELVEALAGLRPIVGGAVSWPGIAHSHPTARAIRVGGTAYIPEDRQRDGLVLSFSIADNLVLCAYDTAPFARWGQRDRAAIAAHARSLMAAFDVRAPGETTPVARLSGGNQQKVILARELSGQVKLVLANQPTRGLDVGSVEAVHRHLLALREAGCALLLVSSDLDELRALADRIAVLYRGRLIATLPADTAANDQLGLLMAGGSPAPAP